MRTYIDAAIQRSRTTISIFVATMLVGIASYLSIPIETYPDVQVPIVVTTIIHEGISPEDAERLLTKPAELELKIIDGITEVSSFSSEGAATILTEFDISFEFRQYGGNQSCQSPLSSIYRRTHHPRSLGCTNAYRANCNRRRGCARAYFVENC